MPFRVRRRIRRLRHARRASSAAKLLGSLDGPISRVYGFDRGTPIDRVHIEAFLERHAADVRGHVLEVKDGAYARRFGGDRIGEIDVVDIDAANPEATIVGDLQSPGVLPPEAFDCIILTQVLQFLRPQDAVPNLYGALRPGGVLLLSMPVLCRLERAPDDLWRLTAHGLATLLRRDLPDDATIEAEQHGNAASAAAFLLGLAVEDIGRDAMRDDDDRYPVVSLARIARPS